MKLLRIKRMKKKLTAEAQRAQRKAKIKFFSALSAPLRRGFVGAFMFFKDSSCEFFHAIALWFVTPK
jgi:hypothetical protein